MARKLDLEVGIPVTTSMPGDHRISAGVFPAGRYAVSVYSGLYEGLVGATATLLEWAQENNVVSQTSSVDNIEGWEARIEFYLTDPASEPDPQK